VRISLPDVNIWLALIAEGHSHHDSARSWFYASANDSVALCRVTQMGILRLLTNSKVLGRGVRTVSQAWQIQHALRADPRVVVAEEPDGLEPFWEQLMNQPGAGHASWTDAYLAAFAGEHHYTLVTFDRGFEKWPDLKPSILPGPDDRTRLIQPQ
jgi:uncharacterized protein